MAKRATWPSPLTFEIPCSTFVITFAETQRTEFVPLGRPHDSSYNRTMQATETPPTIHTNSIVNIAAYKFVPLDNLGQRRAELRRICNRLGLRGTILLSSEGINLFVAGRRGAVDALLRYLREDPALSDLEAKESFSDRQPFNRMLIKIKQEIIAFGHHDVAPASYTSKKLPPEELQTWLDAGRPVTLLDVRNQYEYRLGTFEGAVTLDLDHFRDFPQAVEQLADDVRNQPVVMFCTGGIRCEKAGPFLEQKGFQQVYQLEGGILKYFEKCGGRHYNGECFVFDQRVALDSTLRETETTQCYRCQSPLTAAEQQSPHYVVHRSCPYCYVDAEQALGQLLASRHAALRDIVNPLPGSQPYTNVRPIFVPATADGKTLIEFLTSEMPFVPATKWRARAAGFMHRNDEPIHADAVVHAGDRIEHRFPNTVEPEVNADIEILFEDDLLVVVNKPAPLPMHPCGRFNRNSLMWILNRLYAPHVLRPGHRLDANTSGVVVLTRTRAAAKKVQPQFSKDDRVAKKYLARINGRPTADEFSCNAPISATAIQAGARTTTPDGLAAHTDFKVLQRFPDGTTLLQVTPRTGRTNQIRLHLWHLSMPVCGDATYLANKQLDKHMTLAPDQTPMCLHSHSIRLHHPETGEPLSFTARPPHWATV